MNVISFLNFKGGVGKTHSSDNLAVGLSKKGFKVLLVDLDPQANTTSMFTNELIEHGISRVLENPSCVNEEIVKTDYDGLDIIPANLSLAIAERDLLLSVGANHNKLQKAIRQLNTEYDYVIIDCPPVLNLLITNALVVSKQVIIPIKIDHFALSGYETTVNHVNSIVTDYELDLSVKILFTMVNRNNTDKGVIERFRELEGIEIFESKIRQQAKPITESSFQSLPVIEMKSNVSNDYQEFVDEVLNSGNVATF